MEVADKIFLDEILGHFPFRKLGAADRLVEDMRRLVADLKQRIMVLAVKEAPTYGWALDKVEWVDKLICTAIYLSVFDEVPEAIFKTKSRADAKKFGIALRRFFMSNRLNPDKVGCLIGVKDAAVFLLAARELLPET